MKLYLCAIILPDDMVKKEDALQIGYYKTLSWSILYRLDSGTLCSSLVNLSDR